MDLLLSGDQQMLVDSAGKALERAGGVKRARALRNVEGGFDRAQHRALAAQGWLGIMVPTERDGLGLGPTELALVMREVGRVLAPEPVAACAVAAWAVAAGGASARHDELLAAIVSGDKVVVPALHGGREGIDPLDRGLQAKSAGGGLVLDGRRAFVPFGPHADGYLVSAWSAAGAQLAYVECGAKGLSIAATKTVDGRDYATLDCKGVAGMPIAANADQAAVIVERLYGLSLSGCRGRDAGRDDSRARNDGRIPEDAKAIRPPDRQLPGVAAPCGRQLRADRYDGVDAVPDSAAGRGDRAGDGLGAEVARVGGCTDGREVGDPDAWRDRLHARARRRALS